MLGWFVGRYLYKNAVKDMTRLKGAIPGFQQGNVARGLANRMAEVESAGHKRGAAEALRLARETVRQATRERHSVVASGGSSFNDPAWLEPAILENWAIARVASLERRISMAAFRKVDQVICSYLIQVLGKHEFDLIIANARNR